MARVRLRRLLALILLFTLAGIENAHAQLLPKNFTIEGRLFDSGGVAYNSAVDVQLDVIEPGAHGTCVLYREYHDNIDVSSTGMTASQFCDRALNEAHVALTPGKDFGDAGAEQREQQLRERATRDSLTGLLNRYGLVETIDQLARQYGAQAQDSAAGFAVGDGLQVVTSAHVVPPDTPDRIDRSIAVQVWQGDDQWQLRSARLLGRDLRNDLALLEIDGPALPVLQLAEQDVPEGTAIALMGFPIGHALGYVHTTHRGIVSAWTAIASPALNPAGLNARSVRQLREGSFKVMQLDAIAYPGNSGGPVLDIETGRVVGVLQGGVVKTTKEAALSAPTGISYAVPMSAVAALLAFDGGVRAWLAQSPIKADVEYINEVIEPASPTVTDPMRPKPTPSKVVSLNSGRPNVVRSAWWGRWFDAAYSTVRGDNRRTPSSSPPNCS